MAITMTRHDFGARDVLANQKADAITVADGTVSEALEAGLYRIYATTKCTIRVGSSALADATGGEPWSADWVEVRYISAGQKIASAVRA